MTRVVDLYTIQIIGPDESMPIDAVMGANVVRGVIAETEENLTGLLPGGYRARIRRWDDSTDEPTQEEDDE